MKKEILFKRKEQIKEYKEEILSQHCIWWIVFLICNLICKSSRSFHILLTQLGRVLSMIWHDSVIPEGPDYLELLSVKGFISFHYFQ